MAVRAKRQGGCHDPADEEGHDDGRAEDRGELGERSGSRTGARSNPGDTGVKLTVGVAIVCMLVPVPICASGAG
jgi:hypothetical protein